MYFKIGNNIISLYDVEAVYVIEKFSGPNFCRYDKVHIRYIGDRWVEITVPEDKSAQDVVNDIWNRLQ